MLAIGAFLAFAAFWTMLGHEIGRHHRSGCDWNDGYATGYEVGHKRGYAKGDEHGYRSAIAGIIEQDTPYSVNDKAL